MSPAGTLLFSALLAASAACVVGQYTYVYAPTHAPATQYYYPSYHTPSYGSNLIPLGTTGTIKPPAPPPKPAPPKKSPKPKDLSKITGGIGSGEWLKSIFPRAAPGIDTTIKAGNALLDSEDAQKAAQFGVDAILGGIFG